MPAAARAEAGPLDAVQGARADWLRGQIAFASGPGSYAYALACISLTQR